VTVDTKNTGRLDELFKPHEQQVDVLKEALKEVSEEQAEKKKKAAKELIVKALELKKQMDDAEKQFTSQKQKWDKELGKVMNRLQNMASGKPLDEGEKDDADAAED
tara:strand:- start:243 stop:560 length:318 start_codon:yes stop_codon:yes gene_type:complete